MKLALAAIVAAATVWVYPVTNSRAIDGDTVDAVFEVRPGLWEREHIRFDCLNAPERNQPGGPEATAKLVAFLADGGVQLHTEWKREKYGRLLGSLWRGDAGLCP